VQDFPWDQTIVGWVHITSASLVAGGLMFWTFFLRRPGVAPETERGAVAAFRPWFWLAAVLLLATGSYTWTVRASAVPPYPGYYFHAVYAKIALWALLFGVAGMVTRPKEGRDPKVLLRVAVALAVATLLLSAFMRRVKPGVDARPGASVAVTNPIAVSR
jgi:hypothetical protein